MLEQEANKLALQEDFDPIEKRRRKLIARLKYMNVSPRSAHFDAPVRQIRVITSRSFIAMARATPKQFACDLIADGALLSLEGVQCVNPKCITFEDYGYLNARTLW